MSTDQNQVAVEASPLTLDQLITQGIQNALQSPTLITAVKVHAEKAVNDAVQSAFGYSSPFREGLTQAVKAALPTVDMDDMASFAVAVRELLQRRFGQMADVTAKANLDHMLNEILPVKTELSYEELRDAFRKKVRKESGYECSCEDLDSEYTWDEGESGSCEGYWDLTCALKPGVSRYSDKGVVNLRFRLMKDTRDLHECWAASVGQNAIGVSSLFSGPLYGFDAMVFRLATGHSRLRYFR